MQRPNMNTGSKSERGKSNYHHSNNGHKDRRGKSKKSNKNNNNHYRSGNEAADSNKNKQRSVYPQRQPFRSQDKIDHASRMESSTYDMTWNGVQNPKHFSGGLLMKDEHSTETQMHFEVKNEKTFFKSTNHPMYIKPEKTKSILNPVKRETNRFELSKSKDLVFKNNVKSEFNCSRDKNSYRRNNKNKKDFKDQKQRKDFHSNHKSQHNFREQERSRGKSVRSQRRERANSRKRSMSSSHARAYRPKLNEKQKQVIFEQYDAQKIGYKDAMGLSYHDRALYRAAKTNYYGPPDGKEKLKNANKTIFIKGINPKVSESRIYEIFAVYGNIEKLDLIRCVGKYNSLPLLTRIVTKMSKGYAFVEYKEFKDAMNAYEIENSEILVDFVRTGIQDLWKPRRLGGGYGGKIKSSQIRPFGISGDKLKSVQVQNSDDTLIITSTKNERSCDRQQSFIPRDERRDYLRLGKNVPIETRQDSNSDPFNGLIKSYDDNLYSYAQKASRLSLFS